MQQSFVLQTLRLKSRATISCAGEFTLRAFLNGRLDLSQAEGIADLINARTTQAAESALSTMQVRPACEYQLSRCWNMFVLAADRT